MLDFRCKYNNNCTSNQQSFKKLGFVKQRIDYGKEYSIWVAPPGFSLDSLPQDAYKKSKYLTKDKAELNSLNDKSIAFIDIELNHKNQIVDFGAINSNSETLHCGDISNFYTFISKSVFICGHNIMHHDLKHIEQNISMPRDKKIIDTLYLSPLLFPKHPYHKLLKDDKIFREDLNNPLNDAKKSRDLFYDEINVFNSLDEKIQKIYCFLLFDIPEFKEFFIFNNLEPSQLSQKDIKDAFRGSICENIDLTQTIRENPIELAYALAIIGINCDKKSITPPWVTKHYPKTNQIIKLMYGTPCKEHCPYCNDNLNIHKQLKRYFNYNEFRKYKDENLQEKACFAAVQNKSLIAIFPTGGGKSLTFQLPALMLGQSMGALTVVISPLQSLMKDQIDNLEKKNIMDAVTINGLLNTVERTEAFERIQSGVATILYISPEQLRSKAIEHLLLSRNVVRFVIDEAHCFSAWGQDFRVDYLYIGDFIKKFQEKKNDNNTIAISCFTATAKPKVIMDIKQYFYNKLGIDLELYASTSTRENLKYSVWKAESPEQKYSQMRSLIEARNCSTIVYVQSVSTTNTLADRLTVDGFPALPYNGKMKSKEKIAVQNDFMNDNIKVIVATSAFGMGVDKSDIGLIIHYDVPATLEDYMQEPGRAARNLSLNADCYILFSETDVDKHFVRLNQTKLTMNEIQQIWKAVKKLTKYKSSFCRTALEIAREAGWDISNNRKNIEVKVKTAILALEKAGYVRREENTPHLYGSSLQVASLIDAEEILKNSDLFNNQEQFELAKNIIRKLISNRSKLRAGNDIYEGIYQIDWLAFELGKEKKEIINTINLLRQIDVLLDEYDMTAVVENDSIKKLEKYFNIESYLIKNEFIENKKNFSLKELNKKINDNGIKSDVYNLQTIFNYWKIKEYIEKGLPSSEDRTDIVFKKDYNEVVQTFEKRIDTSHFIVEYLINKENITNNEKKYIDFSLVGLLKAYNGESQLSLFDKKINQEDLEDALLYLHKMGILSLEGGFIVLYSAMKINRLILDNKIKYKKDDYKFLDEYYKQKIQQIHIVGELLNLLVGSYRAAIQFIKDYFQIDYKEFIAKYFKEREREIQINMTPGRYRKLFGSLSQKQREIIDDNSKYIVVAAGPGSGKTRVLVHKLASLLTLEDIKTEQLLMLTFSRASATEFKQRLYDLIGSAAAYVEIKTFHSYCFDIIGQPGELEKTDNIVKTALEAIARNDIEPSKLTKAVLVIDEAQDMSKEELLLIESLINYNNEDMRLIAVGDDDQNIYEFRGSNSKYFQSFIEKYNTNKYEMTENFRSCKNIVLFANAFAKTITNRMKTMPCFSKKPNGIVKLIKCSTRNIEIPIINEVINNRIDGTTCILTNTNYEALQILGLLNKNNIPAKLIQSLDGFKLANLYEIRFIFELIKTYDNCVQISDEVWNEIKKELQNVFERSSCLSDVMDILEEFNKTNPKKYRSDLESFFAESKYEDFFKVNSDTIVVSTIHKTKGQEYDNVYIMLKNTTAYFDEDRRKLYVGITRAKNNLTICYNNNLFDEYAKLPNIKAFYDNIQYDEPKEIILQLTHKDVVLNYFIDKISSVLMFRSGDMLEYNKDYMFGIINNQKIKIIKISQACKEYIEQLQSRGYKIKSANIQYIVYWKNQDDKDIPIVLPIIYFAK